MKKKIGVMIAFILMLLAIVYFSFSNLFAKNINKLRADISYPTSNGVKIECDNSSIDVDASTNCSLTGYLTGGASGISGQFETYGGISISDIDYDGWNNYGTVPELTLVYNNGVTPSNQFVIATFKINGIASGNATVKFIGNDVDDNKVIYSDSTDNSVEVADAIYNINVSGGVQPDPESSDNTLKSLKVNDQTVDLSTLTITVPNTTTQASVVAEKNEEHAIVSGYTNPIDLQVGNNSISIVVTAQNGAVRTYNLTIVREADSRSSDNDLKSLSVTDATISPDFDKNVTNYTVVVNNSVTNVTINAQANEEHATITGYTNPVSLQVGNNSISIVVTAQNGTPKTYNLTIQREEPIDPTKSNDNTLKSLSVTGVTLNPLFNSDVTDYTARVDKTVTTITINAEKNDTKAILEGDGQKTLVNGENSFSIVVTAENNSKKTYTIVITKESSSPTTCPELKLESSVYKIDNDKLVISNVSKDHNVDTIRNNLSTTCGTINVTETKVTLSSDTQIKEYTIERVWLPQTGQTVIKYSLIIAILAVILGALLFIKKKMDK